ncbi:MAG: AraC family transcriptional regulator [Oscillospiraceae bacterium]|jgi:AraC-like DNA-binding protein|nr:AraC family transcriptional regulator [Oscillospiraceae bacterium]
MGKESREAAARVKAYIAAHLREPITARDVADAAGYSPFHAARVFRGETGLTPFEYIRRERLTQSAHALRAGDARVLDVALDFVFGSHEGFTRAFANAFGITPKKYASVKKPDGWLVPRYYLDRQKILTEELTMSNTTIVFTQIVERPARKLLLRHSKNAEEYFGYCEEFGCWDENGDSMPWHILCGIKEALYEPVGLWLPDNLRPEGAGLYAQGVEVPADYAGEIPEGFELTDLPACKLLVFQGEPFKDEEFDTAITALWAACEKFNPEVYGYEYAPELAPRMQLAPMGWRGYIEMRPVREKTLHA